MRACAFRGDRPYILDERVLLALYAASAAAYGSLVHQPAHRLFCLVAVLSNLLGSALAIRWPNVGRGTIAACLGSTLGGLAVLQIAGLSQPEVQVIVDGAASFVHTWSPYLPHPSQTYEFRPYLPGLYLFGIPQAVTGLSWLGPRILAMLLWCAVLPYAVSALRPRPDGSRNCSLAAEGVTALRVHQYARITQLAAVFAFPMVGLSWTASFIDLPQSALTVLALLLASQGRASLAGVATGLTVAMKPTGFCSLFVITLYFWRNRGCGGASRYAITTAATASLLIGPVAIRHPDQLWTNVVLFPTGVANVPTPASTPFPGALLFSLTEHDPLAAAIFMTVPAVIFAVYCARRPATNVSMATTQLCLGLALAFLTAPTGRVGYLTFPLVVLATILILGNPHGRIPKHRPAGA